VLPVLHVQIDDQEQRGAGDEDARRNPRAHRQREPDPQGDTREDRHEREHRHRRERPGIASQYHSLKNRPVPPSAKSTIPVLIGG
jgi:hypothetical protein